MNKKKKLIIGATSAILASSLVALGYCQHSENKQPNLDQKSSLNTKEMDEKSSDHHHDENTIVVAEITEDGYVTIHGDHTHFEKGDVPFDAKFLDSLVLNDKDYKLNKADIKQELAQGYIVKVNGKFYYLPKDSVKQTNVVSKEKAEEITKDNHYEGEEKAVKEVSGVTKETSDGFILTSESQITGRTDSGIIADHNGHSHFIFYDDLKGTKWEYLIDKKKVTTSPAPNSSTTPSNNDGYTFNPKDVIAEDENGYTVKHGDHYHYIPKAKTNKPNTPSTNQQTTSPETSPQKVEKHYSEQEKGIIKKFAEQLNVNEESIRIINTNKGKILVYPHGDHEHSILLGDLAEKKSSPEKNDDLTDKINYISEVYGVPKEAIKVNENVFVFNEPGHEFDPTHIHPYIIPIDKLKIPVFTGNPELDFENELLALAERTGLAPEKIKIANNKFIISHGDHDHALNIKAVEGIDPYFKNKIPNIEGAYVAGDFDKETVNQHINALLAETDKAIKNPVENRRIKRELLALQNNVNQFASNSTLGYKKMLDNFANVYIYKTSEQNELSESTKQYNEALKLLADTNNDILDNFYYNKDGLKTYLNDNNKDLAKIAYVKHILEELPKFNNQKITTIMTYANYFISTMGSNKVSNDLRENIAKLLNSSDKDLRNPLDSNKLVSKFIEEKLRIVLEEKQNKTFTVEKGHEQQQFESGKFIKEISDYVNFLKDRLEKVTFPSTTDNISKYEEYKANFVDLNAKKDLEDRVDYIAKLLDLNKNTIKFTKIDGKTALVYNYEGYSHETIADNIDISIPVEEAKTADTLRKYGWSDEEIDEALMTNVDDENNDSALKDAEFIKLTQALLVSLKENLVKLPEGDDKEELSVTVRNIEGALSVADFNKENLYKYAVVTGQRLAQLLTTSAESNTENTSPEETNSAPNIEFTDKDEDTTNPSTEISN